MTTSGSRPKQRPDRERPEARDQRQRILCAIAELVARRGYQDTSIGLIAERAGMTRKTFYVNFANKEECLLACFDEAVGEARRRILAAIEPEGSWPEQIRAGLGAFLDCVVAEPARARTCLVETMGAGPPALERYENALKSFAPLLRGGRTQGDGSVPLPDILEDTLVGGVVWMVRQRLQRRELEELSALLPRLVKFVLTPYIGVAEATQIAGAATPRPAGDDLSAGAAPAAREVPEDRDVAGESDAVRMRPLRGGSGLPHEAVARDQRRRILRSMLTCVAERGYNETSIADVINAASVSRQTFYELFPDREACFLATYDAAVSRLDRTMLEAAASEGEWPRQVAAAITALTDLLSERPDLARVCLLEAAALGDGSADRRDQDSRHFNALIAIGRSQLPRDGAQPEEGIEEALFGGVTTLMTRRVIAGETAVLGHDAPELIEFVLSPFLGQARAREIAVGYVPDPVSYDG